jgi:ATP-dependent DNA ligase
VPNGEDQNVYLVVDDLGRNGRIYREADVVATDLETAILDLLEGGPSRCLIGWRSETSSLPMRLVWPMATRKPGIKASYPGFIEPALATSIEKVPSGERWVHEIKFDGYRVQVHLRDAAVKVFTRRGNDWTNRFRKVAAHAWHINAGSAIIDGEVVVPAADGTTDFSVLQNKLKGRSTKLVMVEFDLLDLNGYDLR